MIYLPCNTQILPSRFIIERAENFITWSPIEIVRLDASRPSVDIVTPPAFFRLR